MPITSPIPAPKDAVFIQRSDNNAFYGETHISGSNLLLYIDSDGHVNADTSASFYTLFPAAGGGGGSSLSSSWASSSLSASYALSASWSPGSSTATYTSSLYGTASWAISSSWSGTASYALNASGGNQISCSWASQSLSSSYVVTASFAYAAWTSDFSVDSDFAVSSSYNASASVAISSSYAITASFALNSGGGGTSLVTGSTYPITSSWANNAISANPPSASTDIATKGYVDSLLGGNSVFYLSGTSSLVSETYLLKLTGSNPGTITLSTASAGNNAYVFSWVSPVGIPNVTILPEGLYHVDHTTRKTLPINTVTIIPELYLADSAGVIYYEPAVTTQADTLTNTFTRFTSNIILDTPVTMSLADRLVVKLKITNTGTNDIETQVEGDTLSHFGTPISNANFIVNVDSASVAISASYANTASWALNAINGGTTITTGSTYPITSSWAGNAISASLSATASYYAYARAIGMCAA